MLYRTVLPGVVDETSADLTIVRPATVTVAVHRASTLPAAQLVPSVDELTVLASTMFPTSGLLTVTE